MLVGRDAQVDGFTVSVFSLNDCKRVAIGICGIASLLLLIRAEQLPMIWRFDVNGRRRMPASLYVR